MSDERFSDESLRRLKVEIMGGDDQILSNENARALVARLDHAEAELGLARTRGDTETFHSFAAREAQGAQGLRLLELEEHLKRAPKPKFTKQTSAVRNSSGLVDLRKQNKPTWPHYSRWYKRGLDLIMGKDEGK